MSLIVASESQDQVFASAFSVLEGAIARHAFPAASTAVTHSGRLVALKSFGTFVYREGHEGALPSSRFLRQSEGVDFPNAAARLDTIFDLASVTKVVATTTMAAMLYERGLLELEAPIIDTVPEFLIDSCGEADARRREVTFRRLLAHSSGLPAYEKLFLKARTPDELLRAAFTMPLSADPGTRAEYSDIGFILLGAALERIAQEPMDVFCQREIFGPVGMSNTTFNPLPDRRTDIPPTADEREDAPRASGEKARSTFRRRIIHGEVQDENASVLGGVAGHAGLFSTAQDLARFAQALLNGGSPILRPETIARFARREPAPAGTSRALGWDTPSSPSQSGKYFGPRSYGHWGYTGTSLWIDPDRQLSITLLTNRTWPDCFNQEIKQVRPRFHDAIIEALA